MSTTTRTLVSKLIQHHKLCRKRKRGDAATRMIFLFAATLVIFAAFGAVQAGTVNGSLFVELNADGIRQTAQGENGSGGLSIILKTPGGNGIVGDGDDVTVASDVTGGAGGTFSFTGVAAGTYYLQADLSPFINSFFVSPKDQGSDDTVDSDFDPTTFNTASFSVTASGTVTRDIGLVPMRTRSDRPRPPAPCN